MHRIPEIEDTPPVANDVQTKQMNGALPFGEGKYHCQEFEEMIKNVSEIRHEFVVTTDYAERKKLATQEIGYWHGYMQKREEMLPEKYQIPEGTIPMLKDVFERESERRNNE